MDQNLIYVLEKFDISIQHLFHVSVNGGWNPPTDACAFIESSLANYSFVEFFTSRICS